MSYDLISPWIFQLAGKLGGEENEPELRRLFSVASTLHQNHHEDLKNIREM
jgi:hypothetical protein